MYHTNYSIHSKINSKYKNEFMKSGVLMAMNTKIRVFSDEHRIVW
jgi:hypothetical protein